MFFVGIRKFRSLDYELERNDAARFKQGPSHSHSSAIMDSSPFGKSPGVSNGALSPLQDDSKEGGTSE